MANLNKTSKPTFTIAWGLITTITFLAQLIIELSGIFLPNNFFTIFSFNNLIVWQGDIISAFIVLTLIGILATGLFRIYHNSIDTGVTFLVFGAGLAFIITLFYISLNMASLLSALIATLGADPQDFVWDFRLYGFIVTGFIALPVLSGITYIKEVTKSPHK